jgi:hypothetical protein
MFVLAHANHPEMFLAGLVTGAVLMAAHFVWNRVRK